MLKAKASNIKNQREYIIPNSFYTFNKTCSRVHKLKGEGTKAETKSRRETALDMN